MSHTPGPWITRQAIKPVDGEFDYAIAAEIDGRPQVIAETFGRTDWLHRPDAEANANLIAAAPELLAALEDIANIQPLWNGGVQPHKAEEWASLVGEIKDMARAAIAKAEGKQP